MSKKICVIGTGYVGLITAIGLADFGNYVIGADNDEEKIKMLRNGESPIYEPGIDEYLHRNLQSGRLVFTTDISDAIRNSDVIFIGVGTPSLDNGDADLSQVMNVAVTISKNINNYKIIVIKSTVPVGTNRKIRELIQQNTDKEFDVISNPEFLREGKAIIDFFNPDRVVIGYENEKARDIMDDVYRTLRINQTPIISCNLETAEIIKYASNAFLATKIMFINQIANLAEHAGADVHKIAKAMGMDGRISSKFLHPGPGYGGSCFPKDTKALAGIGDNYNVDMSLIKCVINANREQQLYIVEKTLKFLESCKGKRIAVLGLAFKAGTDDMREAPSILIINELIKANVSIRANDPQALKNAQGIFGHSIDYCENEFDAVKDADMMLILTEWNEYRNIDLERIKSLMNGNVIYDTRNILDKEAVEDMGFIYHCRGMESK